MASLSLQPEPEPHRTPEPHPHPQLQLATLAEPNPNPDGPSYDPPMGVPLLLPAPPSSSSSARRLPPPCWTPDETSCLIDSYRLKWLSLRRSNLRASHWQDVADDIHSRCPDVSPPKTAVQCRHKMEKLRKRYRAELLRAKSIPHHRFSSSWVYFSKMASIDKPSSPLPLSLDDHNNNDHAHQHPDPHRIRITPNSSARPPTYPGFDDSPVATPNYRFKPSYPPTSAYTSTPPSYGGRSLTNTSGASAGPSSGMGMEFNYMTPNSAGGASTDNKKRKTPNGVDSQERGRDKVDDAAMEMADAIRMLGEGFVRMEKMKMDMMRETERLRMDMEMKRTQMLLESQHRIVQAFAKGWADVIDNPDPNKDHAAS